MEFRGDDRGVAVQIGAVLLLGFLVVSMSMYQATVVPQENERVEFHHNQRAVSDMQEVRNGILGAAATGDAAPASVELGTQYRARAMFVNPSPPGGTLSTSALGNVTISNAVAEDSETADFWNGDTRNYSTGALSYRPTYHQYQNAPTTVYENGVLYNRFDRGNGTTDVTVTGQTLVSGARISLVTLTGNLSRGGSGTLSVEPHVVSQSTRTISVTGGDGDPVSVVVPTRLSRADWESLLGESEQLQSQGGHVRVFDHGENAVELVFERGETYQLSMSRIRVGTGSDDTDAAYLTSVDELEPGLRTGERGEFAVEARDAYNNPVAAELTNGTDGGTLDFRGAERRYRYVYTAPDESGEFAVDVSLEPPQSPGFAPRDADDVRYRVNVSPAGTSSDGTDGGDVSGGGSVGDPGFAYEDRNGNRKYDDGTDINVDAEVADGSYDASANDSTLILPESTGIDGESISLTGRRVVFRGEITNAKSVSVRATDGVLDVADSEILSTDGSDLELVSESGDVYAANAVIENKADVTVDAASDLTLDGASVANNDWGSGPVMLTAHDGSLSAVGLSVTTNERIAITGGGAVTLDEATLKNDGNNGGSAPITVTSGTGATLSAANAQIDTHRAITLESGGALVLDDATLDNTGWSSGAVVLAANGGSLSGDGLEVQSAAAIRIAAAGETSLVEAVLRNDRDGSGDIEVESASDADLTRAQLRSVDTRENLYVTFDGSGRTLVVADATFDDKSDDVDVSPDVGTTVNGTPASGSVV